MKNKMKGQQNIRRPLPIRIMAILMAVVMIFSVVYVNNRFGAVRAGDGDPGVPQATMLTDDSFISKTMFINSDDSLNEGTYNIYVPIGEYVNQYTFALPELITPGSEATSTNIYYVEGTSPTFTTTKPEGATDESTFSVREIKTTSLVWSDESTEVSSITSTDTEGTKSAIVKENITYDYKLYKGETECAGETYSEAISAFNNGDGIDGYTKKSSSSTNKNITLNVISRDASNIVITEGTGGVVSVNDQDDTADNTTGTTTNLYYGDVTYSYDGTNFLPVNSVNGFVDTFNGVADGEYTITKRIKSGDTLISEKTTTFTKNNQLLLDCFAKVGTATTRYPEATNVSDKIEVTSAAPNEDVFIHIVTDAICTITPPSSLAEGLSIELVDGSPATVSGGYEYTYKLSATPSKNAGTTTADYSFSVSDGTLSSAVTFCVTFLSSNPRITERSAVSPVFTDTTNQIYYYNAASASISMTGAVNNGTITKFHINTLDTDKTTVTETADIDPSEAGKTEDTVTGSITLNPGMNYYSCTVDSSYGETGIYTPESGYSYLQLYYDNQGPQITDIALRQKINDGKSYNEDGGAASDGDTVTFTEKVSSTKSAYIDFVVNEGDGSGTKKILCTTTDTEATYQSGKYIYTIASDENNNNTTKTYSFKITDNVNNETTVDVVVSFFDDVIDVDYKVVEDPDDEDTIYEVSTSTYFLKWHATDITKSASDRSVSVIYTVVASSDLVPTFAYSEGGGTESEPTYTSTSDESTNRTTYKIVKTFDGNSKTLNNLKLTAKNINDVSEEAEITVLKIDSDSVNDSPVSILDDTDTAVDSTKWYPADLVLYYTFSDDTGDATKPYSGLETVKDLSGVEESSVTVADNKFSVTVNESADASTPTAVGFTLVDAVGNESTYSGSFKVDGTFPESHLTITGATVEDGKEDANVASLSSEPSIAYSPTDKPSGIVATKTTAKITDGNTTKDINKDSTALSDYFASYDDTTVFTVTVYVEDQAGNSSTTAKSFKVDGNDPTSSVSIISPDSPSKGTNFYNKNVKVSFTAQDSNLQGGKITITDNGIDISSSVSWSGIDTGDATATYEFSAESPHNIALNVNDSSGNSASEKKVSFVIDKTGPSVTTLLNGEEYTKDNSYNKTVTTGISYTDANKDDNDITATIVRDIPGGGQSTSTKKGLGPHSISEDGKYTVTYKVVDKAGNSTTTDPIGFTVDNTAPVHNLYVTTANPSKVEDYPNNYINGVGKWQSSHEAYRYGQFYNGDVTVELNYFDYNIDWVYVTDNGEEISPSWTKSGAFGKATYTFTSEGYHDVQIWSKDLSGNETNDTVLGKRVRFTIDRSAPSITTYLNSSLYSEGSGTRYLNTNGSLNVSVSEGNKDTYDLTRSYKVTPPGGTSKTYEDKVDEGTENYSEEADYEVSYVAVDKAGNKSATRNVYFRVDRTAPKLTINGPGSASNASSTSVSFNVQESFYWDMTSCTVKIYKKVDGSGEVLEKTLDMNPSSANYSQSYSFVDDAEYRMEFTAEDKCGNKSQTDYTFIKDGNAPSILLSGVKNYDKTDKNVELTITIEEAFYTSNRVTLSGTRTDIDGKSHKIDFDDFATNRTKISQLQQMFKEDGIYDITVTSTDKAGNSSSKTVHFTIDTTDPVIGDLSKYDGVKLNTFKWDVDLDELVKDLTVCDIKLYLDGALYDGTSDIEDGSHVLKVEATDELGHSSSKEVTFVLDSKAPNIIVMNVEEGDNLLESTDITVTVELDEDSLDTVTLNDKAIDIANNEGKITVNTKGDYVLNATAHDEAGNVSSVEIKFSYGKQTNLLFIAIIAGAAILLLLLLLVFLRRRRNDN